MAFLLGIPLGIWYGFLRPLRQKHVHLADGLFLLGCVWGWLELSFRICAGDLRVGYLAGAGLGGFLCEMTLGMVLRPIFRGFWQVIGKIWRFLLGNLKKIFKFTKKLFASGEKWGTIKWNNRRNFRRKPGGTYGKDHESLQGR